MIEYNQFLKFLVIIFFSINIAACNEIARRSGERQTKSTEELISKSKELQNLEGVCRDLPFFNKITPSTKGISRENDTLFYYYQLKQDFDSLKELVKKRLPEQGWDFKEEDNEIGEKQIEFEKGQYWIQIVYLKYGGEENYATNCKDLTLAR